MKRILTTLILCSVIAVAAFAQGAPQKPATDEKSAALPSVDQILDKYVQAIGGKAAIEKQTSRVSKGTFEIAAFGATGTAEVYAKAPNKAASVINVAGYGVVQEGFDGKAAWAVDPQNGMRDKSGVELAATKLDAEFLKPVKIKQLYPKIVVKGKDKVGDKEVYVLEATPVESSVEIWYFDTQTGLILREDIEREGPQGKQSIQSFLDDYRSVDGVKIPFKFHQVTPAFTIDIKFDEIKGNVPIDDAKFNKPAAQ
jgi:outer membrane lipoprotein-sorting protein